MRFLALVICVTGCAGSLTEAKNSPRPDSEPTEHVIGPAPEHVFARTSPEVAAAAPSSSRCATLDDRHAFWTASAMGAAAASGASGISTIPIKDDNWKIGLAVTALVAGIWSAVSTSASSSSAESWARECAR